MSISQPIHFKLFRGFSAQKVLLSDSFQAAKLPLSTYNEMMPEAHKKAHSHENHFINRFE